MARLTFSQIITQGGVLGGNDAVPAWMAIKLNAWLRKQYAAWPWPFLVDQATGIIMASGLATLDIGGGNGGLSSQISRIFSPVYFRADGYSTRSKAPLRALVGGPAEAMAGNVDPSSQIGIPAAFTAVPKQTAAGLMYQTLGVFPYTDKQYTLAFTYQRLPDDCGDTDVPYYPNEDTLIQAAKVAAIEYDNANTPWFEMEKKALGEKVAADRDVYGGTASFGDTLQLDDNTFPNNDIPSYLNKMGW